MSPSKHLKHTILVAALISMGCLALVQCAQLRLTNGDEAITTKPVTDPPTTKSPTQPPTTAAPITVAPKPACSLSSDEPTPKLQSFTFQKCLVADVKVHLKLKDGFLDLGDGSVDVTNSQCERTGTDKPQDAKLVLKYACGDISLQITKKDKHILVNSISGTYKTAGKDEVKYEQSGEYFVTSDENKYYQCGVQQKIDLKDGAQLVFGNVTYEAYRDTSKDAGFSKQTEVCSIASSFSYGFLIYALAIIAVVVVAYFVVRFVRRNDY